MKALALIILASMAVPAAADELSGPPAPERHSVRMAPATESEARTAHRIEIATYVASAAALVLTEYGVRHGASEINPLLESTWARLTIYPAIKILGAQIGRRMALSRDPGKRRAGRIMQRVFLGLTIADAGWDAYVVFSL